MSIRFTLAILSIVSLWFPSVSALADFESGAAAYTRGDYATALEEWKPLAEAGNVASQFNLGLMYYNGKGTRLDFSEAAKWFRLAAKKGDAAAQINLGVMYFNGEGVELDFEQAHFWFTMAVRLFPPGSEREQAARNLAIAGGNLTAAQISENERKAEALRQEFAMAAPEPAAEALQPAVMPEPEAAGAVAAMAPEGPAAVEPAVAEPMAEAEVAAVEPAAAAEQAAPQVAAPAEQVSPQLSKPESAAVDVVGAMAAEGAAIDAPAGQGPLVAAEAEVAAAAAVEPAAGPPAQAPAAEPAPQPVAAPPVQAVAAPPVQAPLPTSTRRYVIQLASLNDTDTAMAEKTRLENKYAELLGEVEMSVQRAELVNRGTVFRIVIGPYAEKAPADELCGQLKVRKQDCYVVRR